MNKILVVLSMVILGLSISACGKKADDSTNLSSYYYEVI